MILHRTKAGRLPPSRLTSLLLLLTILAPAWIAEGSAGQPRLEAKLAAVGALAGDEIAPPRPTEPARFKGGFTLELEGDAGEGPGLVALLGAQPSLPAIPGGPGVARPPCPASCRPLCEHLPYDANAPPVG